MSREKRLIDADALSNDVDKSKYCNPHTNGRVKINHYNEHDHFLRMISDAPTVDAVEVVHAKWEEIGVADYKCSRCGFRFTSADPISMFQYCRCGAKMDGGNEDG